MAKVIQFPKASLAGGEQIIKAREGLGLARVLQFARALNVGVWMVAVLMWPLLRWLIALDVFWRLCLMMVRGGVVQFVIHFLCFAAAHYYVAVYRPQGVEKVLQKKKFSR